MANVLEELNPEAVQEQSRLLGEIKEFIINRTQVVGLEEEQSVMPMDIAQFIGDDETNSIALAAERKIPLYSDDRVVRKIAAEQGIVGFWTQNLLRAAVLGGKLA